MTIAVADKKFTVRKKAENPLLNDCLSNKADLIDVSDLAPGDYPITLKPPAPKVPKAPDPPKKSDPFEP